MRLIRGLSLLIFLLPSAKSASAQNRLKDRAHIGWYNFFLTIPAGRKIGIHTETQFRRTDWIKNGQQLLLRTGLNVQLHEKLLARIGFAQVETYAYGTFPVNAMGKTFTERRIYEQLNFTDKIEKYNFLHRFILEQRWVGKYSKPELSREDLFVYTNRLRYMFRIQRALYAIGKTKSSPYVSLYDELMIGFGKNVGENVFDQNRLGILAGLQVFPGCKVEAGYLNQILQLGREVDAKNVFQFNQGVIFNLLFTLKSPK